jgi:hypothetical protein
MEATVKECCQDETNRTEPEEAGEVEGATVTRCRTCKCRHFEVSVDPVRLSVRVGA